MTRMIRWTIGLLAAILVMQAGTADAQRRYPNQMMEEDIGLPHFHLDAITFLSDDPTKTRVVVYVQIMYDNLQFVNAMPGYKASYEVDFNLLAGEDASAPRMANRLWRSSVTTFDYEETNSRDRFDVSETTLDLPPGTYFVVATLTDLETRRTAEVKSRLTIPSYNEPGLQLGDLVLAKHIRKAPDGTYEMVPNVDRVIRNPNRPMFVYYETYPREADRLDVYYRILNETGEVVLENSFDQPTTRPITRDYFTVDITELSHGRYVIELQVRTRTATALKGAQFRIKMAGLPNMINDLDVAIKQLRYIAKRKNVREMLKAKGPRKETLFREFWKDRDPTEQSAANELMEEYYWRVGRATQMFGSFRDGWETDRGEVFIRYGVPDQIERHPYDINSRPYEIWYYHRHNRRFVFVDEMGFGEYRLVTNLW